MSSLAVDDFLLFLQKSGMLHMYVVLVTYFVFPGLALQLWADPGTAVCTLVVVVTLKYNKGLPYKVHETATARPLQAMHVYVHVRTSSVMHDRKLQLLLELLPWGLCN